MQKRQLDPQPETVHIKKVVKENGKMWLTQAYRLFTSATATWLGISSFLMLILIIPYINNLTSILMPLALGGLMIGCAQSSDKASIKFDHLFAGLKNHSKPLIILSMFYGLASFAVFLITYYLMLSLGYDVQQFLPSNAEQMTAAQMVEWMSHIDQSQFINMLLVALIISLALLVPVFMAFWFAPALVVFNNQPPAKALSLSFSASKLNMMAFTIYGLIIVAYCFLFMFVLSIVVQILPILALPAIILGYLSLFSITITSIYTSYQDIFCEDDKNQTIDPSSDSSMLA